MSVFSNGTHQFFFLNPNLLYLILYIYIYNILLSLWISDFRTFAPPPSKMTWNIEVKWRSHRELSCDGIKANVDGVLKVWGQRDLRTLLLLLLVCCHMKRGENNQPLCWKHTQSTIRTISLGACGATGTTGHGFGCYSLLSPPGKMERRRAFLFFSSGAMGSGLEAWLSDEESRELLFILRGGAGGFSSISTLSDIFSSTHKVLREEGRHAGATSARQSYKHWMQHI